MSESALLKRIKCLEIELGNRPPRDNSDPIVVEDLVRSVYNTHGITLNEDQKKIVSSNMIRILNKPEFQASMSGKDRMEIGMDTQFLAQRIVEKYFCIGLKVFQNQKSQLDVTLEDLQDRLKQKKLQLVI